MDKPGKDITERLRSRYNYRGEPLFEESAREIDYLRFSLRQVLAATEDYYLDAEKHLRFVGRLAREALGSR
jgi:ABC-type cobalt transport system substrate-binding protein